MYLSQLQIHGFKSFANKIKLDFDSGLTAIIGPNGSGKSNIVDAIRWVLGEQRVSNLRSDKMESVIFNGTKTRKPMGMAEVSLTIQNNRNILDTEFDEVVISRRLYRSGESQYLINKVPVRLKDVINLFMDTGMGSNSYSVIELKMVESILSENKQERRVLFEEAAGVVKYKTRRKSALRKLEATQIDLSRINDIIIEVEKTVASLHRQVGKARRYLEYTEKLKKNEIDLSVYRYHRLKDEISPLERELVIISKEKEESSHQITIEEALLEDYNRQSIVLEQDIKEVNNRIYTLDSRINSLNQENAVAETKIDEMAKNKERFLQEIEEHGHKIEMYTANKQEILNELESLKEKRDSLQQAFNVVAGTRREMQKKIEAEKAEIDKLTREYRRQFQQLSDKKEAIQKKNYQLEFNKEQIGKIEAQRAQMAEEYESMQGQSDSLRSDTESIEAERLERAQQLDALRQQNKELERELQELQQQYNRTLSEFEKIKSRRTFYENVISNFEGHAKSTQFIMSQKDKLQGVHGPLAELISAEEPYAALSEQILGEALNYIVVDTVADAERLIETVKSNKQGRLTCIPLERVNTLSLPQSDRDGDRLLKHIQCAPDFKHLLEILLGDVIVVDNLRLAISESGRNRDARYISLEGEEVRFNREISGGSASQKEASILTRKNKLRELKESSAKLERELMQISSKMDEYSDTLSSNRDQMETLTHDLEAIQKRFYQQINEAKQAEYRKEQIAKQMEASSYQIKRLQQQIEEIGQSVEQMEGSISGEQESLNNLERESIKRTNAFDLINDEFQQLLDEYQQTQLTLSNANNQVANRENDLRRLEQSLKELQENIERRQRAIKEIDEGTVRLAKEIEQRKSSRDTLWEERDALDKKRETLDMEYSELKDKKHQLENEIREFRRKHDSSLEKSKKLEVKINEYSYKTESLRNYITEEYGIDIDAHIPNGNLDEDETDREIQSLKNRIKHLGPVNPLAVSEYETENERLNFLTSQRDDLERAEASLTETIDKINKTAREQFVNTFEAIKSHFEEVFKSFFANGHGTLKMDPGQDPLEADIDIEVTAKGRNLQTLSLLSGGEKTLTAISLLFAIYLVKPSPFCILDEVDAPLDDVNIKRFTEALKTFTDKTQFMVVTHNKRTMEAAKNMYGITMEEEGVSKIVSVSFE
ncbi:MAG TPA: chromosome segregation protein SMC [Caldithrix abyssi]|uniref:Chromosome partition protein Smc n=1 Tax=Caldithrix abyssi TaxID=187145 RepID=A0A7V1LN40_CALAY|nr:chromosome segregation protein SMC [Caldithrix abyssi]